MEKAIDIAIQIAPILAIAAVVAAIIMWVIGKRISDNRELLRSLRVALDRDPSPAQISEAIRMWPEATQYPGHHQVDELRRIARDDETKRAKNFEMAKKGSRVFATIAFLAVAIYIGCLIYLKYKPA